MDEIIMTFMICTMIVFCFGCMFGFELNIGEKKLGVNVARVGKPIFRSEPIQSVSEKDIERLEERVSECEIALKLNEDSDK